MFKSLAGLLVALLIALSTFAQKLDTTAWITNGEVNAMLRSGNTLYLGGKFTYVGRFTGNGAPLNISDGTPSLASLSRITGNVKVSLPDGKGGWFIGGNFSAVGGVTRLRLAHILPNGQVDPLWNAGFNEREPTLTLSSVSALALRNDTLYVGGYFTAVGGQQRMNLAALDARTARVTPWNPGTNGQVLALTIG